MGKRPQWTGQRVEERTLKGQPAVKVPCSAEGLERRKPSLKKISSLKKEDIWWCCSFQKILFRGLKVEVFPILRLSHSCLPTL